MLWKRRGEYGRLSGGVQKDITKKANFELALEDM